MYKCIRNLLLLTLLMGASSFSLNASNPTANGLTALRQMTKKNLGFVNADQTAPTTITGTWGSLWNGSFSVYLFDMIGGQPIPVRHVDTFNHFAVFEGLTIGHTYKVCVTDNNTTKLSDPRLVTY